MGLKKINSNHKKFNLSGFLLVFTGISLMGISMFYRSYRSKSLSFEGEIPQASVVLDKKPVHIIIEKPDIDLAVNEAVIANGIWSVSEDSANHLNTSATPGNPGNIVIYAHNKNHLFGPLRWIEVGAKIELINEDNETFDYYVTNKIEVKPDDISYVLPTNEETLTLYTCTGVFDSKRLIIVANKQ